MLFANDQVIIQNSENKLKMTLYRLNTRILKPEL